ncbi:MAG: peptidoglycan-binding protein, partial [Clostridiales bacterium]|nr:peptidoglycan-binding protein [Clostridiales bacterium]
MTSSTHSSVRRMAVAIALIAALLMPSAGIASGALKVGSSGSNVKTVQKQLAKLGYYSGKADGRFDRELAAAVKAFQQANGLAAVGQVSTATRKALASSRAIDARTYQATRPLKQGMKNAAVQTMQKQLEALGYFDGDCTGQFGPKTKEAVALFQKANGLKADGIATTDTRKLINGGKAVDYAAYKAKQTLKYGASGSAVDALQKRLKALKYPIAVNGKYDKATVSAVKAFQKANGLATSGEADAKTRAKLSGGGAVAASSGSAAVGTLKSGMKNADVKAMQTKLKQLGYFGGNCTGQFGPLT